ncbi:MAG: cell division protein ZapA [Schwartzia sp.]|nr:cell division protein ZapA [Schwartzia sp. (in: firmicutes)]MBR1761623.1 cell division protein ZapA [Schwartzia sp. (in: firmicutes)]MBR1885103.1 cell division protein ZapA [Schwartzia sp. (in: firmicutes)]
MDQKVVVEIFGEKFSLKTDQDPEYLKKLAEVVDKEMRAVSRQANNLPPIRIGVLAALKFADEYFQLKKDFDEMAELVRKR